MNKDLLNLNALNTKWKLYSYKFASKNDFLFYLKAIYVHKQILSFIQKLYLLFDLLFKKFYLLVFTVKFTEEQHNFFTFIILLGLTLLFLSEWNSC